MKNKLRVSNIVMTGKLPFKHKLSKSEVDRLIMKSDWIIIDEVCTPILQKRITRGNEISVHGRRKGWCISVWMSGAINIVGLRKVKEGKECYDIIFKEIKKYCPRVFKE